jgi:surface antigen
VAASAPSSLFQQARYRGTSGAWHVAMRRLQARAWVLALALMGGGCSVSYQLDSVLANKDAGAAAEADSPRAAAPKTTAEMPAETDLAIARAAVSEVLIKGGRHSSVPWENPKTGARGTVTPLASAYSQDGVTCRDFLASYVKNGTESWLQGAACRAKRGKWEVRNLRPWNNT